jgi:hypothetical protein
VPSVPCLDPVAGLDPGIARFVEVLRAADVETFESCEGGDGHSAVEPIVRFFGGKSEGFRALVVALTHGLPVLDLRRFWQVVDGESRISATSPTTVRRATLPVAMRASSRVATPPEVRASRGHFYLDLQGKHYRGHRTAKPS